jgi:cell division septation protein DedD
VHRYGTTPAWIVGALATAAAAIALAVSGGVSAGFDFARAFGPRLARNVEGAGYGIEAKAATVPVRTAIHPAAAAANAEGWQIQVGALRRRGAAEALLSTVASEFSELAELTRAPQVSGQVTRARFGGIGGEAAALGLCAKLALKGRDCFVVPPAG